MKRRLQALFAVLTALFICAAAAGCEGGNSEKDIDARLEKLDKMSADDAEKQIEKNLGKLDKSSSDKDKNQEEEDDDENAEAAAAAEYLAETYYKAARGYAQLLAIQNVHEPDLNEIKYDIAKEYGLETSGKYETEINGKKKKIKWDLDKAYMQGKIAEPTYDVKYVTVTYDGVSRTYPEGADKIEFVDAFEGLNVIFSGIAPMSKAEITGGNSLCKYTIDKPTGIFNGDVVTVKAEFKSPQSDKELNETTKQFTASDLASYALSLDDITDEVKNKMIKQTEDEVTAKISGWRKEVTADSVDFIGFYFLSLKSGFSASPVNRTYCVYKINTTVIGQKPGEKGSDNVGNETCYTFCAYDDIIILPDGICSVDLSKGRMTSVTSDSDYGYDSGWGFSNHYTYPGYRDADAMFSECVTSNISSYSYESTVKEP